MLLRRELATIHGYPVVNDVLIGALKITGTFNLAALERAVAYVAERHSALRTVIQPNPDVPLDARRERLERFGRTCVFEPGLYQQTVEPGGHRGVVHARLRHGAPVETEREFVELTATHLAARTPSSVSVPSGALVGRIAADVVLVAVAIDHLVCDRYGLGLVCHDIAAHYTAFCGGPPVPETVARQSVEYPDLELHVSPSALAFWTRHWAEHVHNRVTSSEMPFFRTPSENRPAAFARRDFSLSMDETAALRHLCSAHRVSVHMLAMAAYGTVLCLYTQRNDVGMWTHFANRANPLDRRSVGWLANTHMLNVHVSPEDTTADVLCRIKESMLLALEHQGLSLATLWNLLGCAPRFTDALPLVDVHSTPRWTSILPDGGCIERVPLAEVALRRLSGLGLYLHDFGQTIGVSFGYDAHLYDEHGIATLLADFRTVLQAFSTQTTRVSELDCVGRWNGLSRARHRAMGELILADGRMLSRLASTAAAD